MAAARIRRDANGTWRASWQEGSVAAALVALPAGVWDLGGGVSSRWQRRLCASAVVLAVAAPDQPHHAIVGALEQHAQDGLRPSRIVEAHAQVGLVGALLGPAPGGADLGGAQRDAEVRRTLAVLPVVGEDLDAAVQHERADVADVAVLDGLEGSDNGHGLSFLLISSASIRGRGGAKCPCAL